MKKYLLYGGIVAPVLYVVTIIVGGLIRPGYSHIANAISELTAAGAPNKALLDPLLVHELIDQAPLAGLKAPAPRSPRRDRGRSYDASPGRPG